MDQALGYFSKIAEIFIVKNCYSKETVEQWSMYTLYKVGVKLMYTLYNDLTIFSKKWLKSGLLQFLTMWILWDRKCEYGFFHITHAKNSSNHSSSTRDLTRFFGICDVEKAILTFPPHSILSMQNKCFMASHCNHHELISNLNATKITRKITQFPKWVI